MKRFFAVLSVFILIISCGITVFSFEIDGTDTGTEWENSQSILLFSGEESNNKVSFGAVRWVVEDGSLYLCFNFIEPDLIADNTNAGVSFSVEDSEYYVVTAASDAFYDSDKYRVEGAFSIDIAQGALCEARVGFKYGIPNEINCRVRFIDSEGSYSNVYDFYIENETDDYCEDTYIKTEKETSKSNKTDKTTKETTTKAAKTTKTKTTKASKTTDKSDDNVFDLIDILLREETTEKTYSEKTTKKKTSKTTKKSQKSAVTSVKIIEKEVYVTVNTSTEASESLLSTQAEQSNNTNINQSKISTSEGKKYQTLVAIAGSIALIAVAVLGALGSNRKEEINTSAKIETDNKKYDDSDLEEQNEDN